MKLNELIEQLQELADNGLGEADVRLAIQPSWPFEHSIGRIVTSDDGLPDEDDDEEDDDDEAVIYIGEGSQLGYLNSRGTNALGWGRRR
jgi:hypothetical protein